MYPDPSELFTFQECREFLKVGKNTLLDLIHTGKIDAFKIGTKWKIPRAAVLEYIKNKL